MSSNQHDPAQFVEIFSTLDGQESTETLKSTEEPKQAGTSEAETLTTKKKTISKKVSSLPRRVSLDSSSRNKYDSSRTIKQSLIGRTDQSRRKSEQDVLEKCPGNSRQSRGRELKYASSREKPAEHDKCTEGRSGHLSSIPKTHISTRSPSCSALHNIAPPKGSQSLSVTGGTESNVDIPKPGESNVLLEETILSTAEKPGLSISSNEKNNLVDISSYPDGDEADCKNTCIPSHNSSERKVPEHNVRKSASKIHRRSVQKPLSISSPGVDKLVSEPARNEKRPASAQSNRISRSTVVVKEKQPRARRSLSFHQEFSPQPAEKQRIANVIDTEMAVKRPDESSNSADSLRNLNLELRDQVTKLRYQLETQKGSIKQAQWQKVVDIRQLRQQENKRLTLALIEQKEKLDKERAKDLDHLRDQLTAKAEADLQKLTRHKDVEIIKLRLEISCKDVMVQRLLGENRHASLKLNIDVRRSKLLDELKELRREKRELEDSLSSATSAERTFSDDLRRHTQSFEAEVARVRREAQLETKQLIEQLKNKDKLISQLEKDLGHQWVAAHLAALERECSEGPRGSAMSAPSHPLSALPEASYDPSLYPWTPTSASTTGGVEEEKSYMVESYAVGKDDLPPKLKDNKEKNKELVEKCRTYLQMNKELTAQNRAYKDGSEKVLQENKKMQELLEHSKLRVLQLSRSLSEAHADKTNLERQTEKVDELRKEMMEDKKTINALKQACTNKDRRIELMQHRKKKRRLAEKNMGVKETFFGYDEDTKSVDSETSFSSMSHSTVSDEDVWDEVLSAEETERNYQRAMMELLRLQRSYTQLQAQCGHLQDPQREAMNKMTLQNDLFNAQCRIEKLEKLINEIGEGEVLSLLKEREIIIASNKEYFEKAQYWEKEGRHMQHELNKALEKCEDLEFQLMEIEQANDEKQSSFCEDSVEQCPSECHEQLEQLAAIDHSQRVIVQDMEELRKELVSLLKGKGREGDAALKRLDKIAEDEKKRAASLERIAGELQMKVISLQKEKDVLYDQISHSGHKPGKGDNSAMVAARERQENMELKNEIAQLSCSESKLLSERIHLYEQLEDWKTQYDYLKQQLDILTKTQSPQKQSPPLKVEASEGTSSGSSSPSSSSSLLTRRPSKDRKSKPRSGDDPMETKRRRSSKDVPDDTHSSLKSVKSLGDVKDSNLQSFMRSFKSIGEVQTKTESADEIAVMKKSLRVAEVQLQALKEENLILRDQIRQCALEKSSEAEADQQLLLDKLEVLEAEVGFLRNENCALAHRLKQRMEEYQEELNPKVTELEDYCEDLQERLHASEMTERHVREKLKIVEQSIDDAESSENAFREKYEDLLAREAEFKKQIQALQRTGEELRDIVLDKDIVEQALRDKVDFLQKAEAAASKRIDELEIIEQELREQLELRNDPRDSCQRELNKIQELKHQITFLETDNKALSARVAELEENEEILRENWRRVADEDFNRTQCLEEKVKMVELHNRDLKSKLADAQEYFVINTIPASSETSLAAELAQSQSKVCRRAATFDDAFDGDDDDSQDGGDSDSTETSQTGYEKRILKEKLRQLESKLSDVAEEKNTKIESLQEKIVSLKENEIKLSETISELEMTERELRAKLALYESSEVTVEKMLKYQSKIEELRTSQESLLDQIESMESQGMTLQEHMQEMERTLRGKIVTLEVEMRGFKQKELKDAGRIRELEKQEKELSQKVSQQAEKENGLYVKISSLMDEVKRTKEELSTAKSTMLEKEDKVRNANLLEVKFLEKEMENGKKLSALSTKLRHKEEELRQKEASHDEEMAILRQELSEQDREKSNQIAILENQFAQKEKDLRASISSLREDVKVLISERDECMQQIKELTDRNTDLNDKDIGYNNELEVLRQEMTSVKMSEKEYEDKIRRLQENLEQEKQKAVAAENKVVLLEKELSNEKENVAIIENKIVSVKRDIGEKMKNIEMSFVEKESEYKRQKVSLKEELSMKEERVRELEKELGDRLKHVRELEAECDQLNSKAAFSEIETLEKLADLGKILAEKDEQIEELQKLLTDKETEFEDQVNMWKTECELKDKVYNDLVSSVKTDRDTAQKELKDRVLFLNTQLMNEVTLREKQQSALEQAEAREKKWTSEVSDLKKEIELLKQQLTDKVSGLEEKNKEISELHVELSNMRHSWKTVQSELMNFKEMSKQDEGSFKNQITEKDQNIEMLKKKLDILQNEIQQLELELSQKDNTVKEVHTDKEKVLTEKELEIKLLVEEKIQQEVLIQEHIQKSGLFMQNNEQEQQSKKAELERLNKELLEKDVLLQREVSRKNEMNFEMQALHSQIKTLKQELELTSHTQELKTLETENYLKEIQNLQETTKANSTEIELLQKKIVEKNEEINKRTIEQRGTESLITSKHEELEQARTELQKCLQEIKECKNRDQEKENESHQQDQKCREISADMEKLNVQFTEQTQECKQLESKVAHIQLKLVEAENRYRELEAKCASLEMQLQESFVQAQYAEQVFRSKEQECQQLELKLTSIEKDFETNSIQAEQIIVNKGTEFKQLESELEKAVEECQQLKANLAEREDGYRQIVEKLSALELDHQQLESISSADHQEFSRTQTEYEDSKSEANSLRQRLSVLQEASEEAQTKLRTCESKLREVTIKCESVETKLNESEGHKQNSSLKLSNLQSEITSLESRHNDAQTKLKQSENLVQELQKTNDEKNASIKSLQSEVLHIGSQYAETKSNLDKTECDVKLLYAQLDTLTGELDVTRQALRSSQENCDTIQRNFNSAEDKLVENSQYISELKSKSNILEKALQEKESLCRDSQSDLSSLRQEYVNLQTECDKLTSNVTHLQQIAEQSQTCSACQRLQDEIQSKNSALEKLHSSEAELTTVISQLRQDNASLKTKLSAAENTHSNDADLSELIETNLILSGKLYQAETRLNDSSKTVVVLEHSLSNANLEIDKYVKKTQHLEDEKKHSEAEHKQLLEKLNGTARDLETLKSNFAESKARLETNLAEISNSKEHSERALRDMQSEVAGKDTFIAKLEQEITNLKLTVTESNVLKSQVFVLNNNNEDSVHDLGEPERKSSRADIVKESDIIVSVVTDLQGQPPSQIGSNNSSELRGQFSHLEDHCDGNVKLEQMVREIESYRKADIANQEKLFNLEKLLKDMREKDVRMSERLRELEGREKELLEQIADIEVTVIVPLETENQEMKDEINVIRQERDDAQARASKWSDGDEDQQDIEAVHKSLEDALINRDEMEKKIEILCADVSKLEQERELLRKKILDLECNEGEHMEKIETLEEEVGRLHGLEKTTSLVEETETCLIDRVLDLEEKEQQLLTELAQLKKVFRSCSDQTNGQVSYESLLERLKYLEKKNDMLQDAEGRYMDKIVELEELQHRLQSEVLTMRSSPSDSTYSTSAPTNPVPFSTDSVLLSMQNPAMHKKGIVSEDTVQDSLQTSNSVSSDTSDLWHPSEQTVNNVEMSSRISELENQILNLIAECEVKSSKLKYLEEKCELLHDSESKLMERLLESEESFVNQKDDSSDHGIELKKKVESLLEENEFLAENVENFKQLYKEEKEKTNDLHDRLMENSSLLQELHDAQSDLKATQQMVEEIQSEYEEQLSEREESEAHLNNLLTLSQHREKDLQAQLASQQQSVEELQRKVNSLGQDGGNSLQFGKLMEEEKLEALQKLEADLQADRQHHEQQLLKQIQLLESQLLENQATHKQMKFEHHNQLEDLIKDKKELQNQVDYLSAKELDLGEIIRTLQQREQDLQAQVRRLEKQLEEMAARMEMSCDGHEEASVHSDSGLSADEQRTRYYSSDKSSSEQSVPHESPVATKIFSSSLTFNLSSGPNKTVVSRNEGLQSSSPEPVAPPRLRGKHRQSSIDSVSQEELMFLVEELQTRESALKKRIQELEAAADSDLSQQIEELEIENQNLGRKLKYAESQMNRSFTHSPTTVQDSNKEISFSPSSIDSKTSAIKDSEEISKNILSVSSSTSANSMFEKPEDVLHKRIKELENLDKHNKIQLSELEKDREVLHEIARKDKATMHDLNVKIRELQLSERSLKEQVRSLEVSESSLYTKCEDLESTKAKLEDRVHELAVHERRLRELVRKLKLDEEHWLSKSGGMESAVAELAANEQQLKRLLQDREMEKGGLSERVEYLEARIQELENVEATLLQRIKNGDNMEVSLQNKLIHLENSERAAYSKVSELDVMNLDLSHKLQKEMEENVVHTQHIAQLQGQIHELDRRLLSSQDSELAYKQHVESLQKNESSLQKKVREYELREIDSQARIRELEQVTDILNDKMAALQRSENRLKFRVHELESATEQETDLTSTQRQSVPQELDEAQKHVVFLQNKVESLQLQLREALKTTMTKLASKTDESKKVSMPVDDYRQLQTKSALLEETMYQMEEVERVNKELSETVLQLRQGKGASGHEVEIEVLKRRLASYKTFINKLKSSLSMGQATSLWDPELDSGLQGDTLPARQIHGLESERVLQSVRGLQEGKANTSSERGAQETGLTSDKEPIVQSIATVILSAEPANVDLDDDNGSSKTEQPSRQEESHWRAIEARKPKLVASSRGGANATVGTVAKQATPTHPDGSKESLPTEVEEVMVGIHLRSESELSSHYRTTQNDTDSSNSPVPPPRRMRAHRAGKSTNNNFNSSGNESSDGTLTESDVPAFTTAAMNKKHFGDEKSLPSMAYKHTSQERSRKQAPLTRFGEDSFYLPSSAQEGADSLDDGEAPPLPPSGPPGEEPLVSSHKSPDGSKVRKDFSEKPNSSLSIRDRIAMIERNLQTGSPENKKAADEEVSHWKKQANEGQKQAEVLEKDNKSLKEELLPPAYRRKEKINRLEKELEEKRRYINLLELWLSNLEELLKNKNKKTDRELVEQLHQELNKLCSELNHIGYHSEDAVLDPAALKTELEHRNKEIVSKRNEIDYLNGELKRCQRECRSTERMRRNTLDSLRALELELLALTDAEKTLLESQEELQSLRTKYEGSCADLEKALSERNKFELALKNSVAENDYKQSDLKKAETQNDKLKPLVEELTKKVEDLSRTEAKKLSLEEQLNDIDSLLNERTEKMKEVYEENLILRDHVNESEAELARLRNLCDDFNNLSARYDELQNHKEQERRMIEPLQEKLERLARKCQEKDMLLSRLGAELRRSTYRPSSALDDLGHVEKVMDEEEYNTDFPKEAKEPNLLKAERYKSHSSLSSDELELNQPYSDTDVSPVTPSKRKRSAPYVNIRPRSVDTLSSRPRNDQGAHAHPRSFLEVRGSRAEPQAMGLGASQDHFMAVADYDPGLFSQSGRPGLELALREGELVHVTGPVDRSGYCEAEVNGKIGLVPANYLQPIHGSGPTAGHDRDTRLSQQPQLGHRPGQGVDIFRPFNQETASSLQGSQDILRARENGQPLEAENGSSLHDLMPDPPSDLYVKNIVNERSILLSWLPPRLDRKGNNKGEKLLGFRVYVDNQEYMKVLSPAICEVVLENLDLRQPHQLAVQALYASGHVSQRREVIFEGVLRMAHGQTHLERVQGDEDLDTDLSPVLSNAHYKRGHRKTVIALYDYNPDQQSPLDYTYFELAFQAGQVLHVYGEPRPDGFFHGEIDGKRGLVPACFVEDRSERSLPFTKRNH